MKFSILVACVASFASLSQAQVRNVSIPYRPTCSTCRVDLTLVARIGRPGDSVTLHETSGLARDGRGRFYAMSRSGTSVVVYDSAGRLVSTFGRAGGAPGEFWPGINHIAVSRDSIFVFEPGRVSVFSPAHRFVRAITLPAVQQYGAAVSPDGRILITANIRTPTNRQPMHLLDASGRNLRSFGAGPAAAPAAAGGRAAARAGAADADPAAAPGVAIQLRPFLASFRHSTVWQWDWAKYSIEEWGLDGVRRAVIQVADVPWLGGSASAADLQPANRPPEPRPAISLSGVTSDGLLWVQALIPASTTARSGKASGAVSAVQQMLGEGSLARNVVEVIDPRRGQLLHSQEVETPIQFFPDSDLAWGMVMDPRGVVSLLVWKVALTGR
jgi:hypothetical protein